MASSESRLIPFNGKKGPPTSFSKVSFQNVLDCCDIWLTLDGEYYDVARRSVDFARNNVQNVETDNVEEAKFSYHRACYSALTNTISTKRAPVRCQNWNKEDEASSFVVYFSERDSEEAQQAKKDAEI